MVIKDYQEDEKTQTECVIAENGKYGDLDTSISYPLTHFVNIPQRYEDGLTETKSVKDFTDYFEVINDTDPTQDTLVLHTATSPDGHGDQMLERESSNNCYIDDVEGCNIQNPDTLQDVTNTPTRSLLLKDSSPNQHRDVFGRESAKFSSVLTDRMSSLRTGFTVLGLTLILHILHLFVRGLAILRRRLNEMSKEPTKRGQHREETTTRNEVEDMPKSSKMKYATLDMLENGTLRPTNDVTRENSIEASRTANRFAVADAVKTYFASNARICRLKTEMSNLVMPVIKKYTNEKWWNSLFRIAEAIGTENRNMAVFMFQTASYTPLEMMPQGSPIPHPFNRDMVKELTRFGTFETWPERTGPWRTRLASAGFYYNGHGQEVVCFSCGLKHNDWRTELSPMEIHRRQSPSCAFVTRGEDNEPIVVDPETRNILPWASESDEIVAQSSSAEASDRPETMGERTRVPESLETVIETSSGAAPFLSLPPALSSSSETRHDHGHVSMMSRVAAPTGAVSNPSADLVTTDFSAILGINTKRPKYPDKALINNRLKTFENSWPASKQQTPSQMAEAGFYHTGHQDGVKCFYCAVGLTNWNPGDNPWVEHARLSEDCPFMMQMKGPEFIRLVKEFSAENIQIDYDQIMGILHDMPGPSNETDVSKETSTKGDSTEDGQGGEDAEDKILSEENEELRQQTMCKICLEKEVAIAFLPCGHIACCVDCALAVRNCPLCRSAIKGTVRVYI